MSHKEIDPQRVYSVYQIIKLGVIGTTRPTVTKRVTDDRLEDNILQTKVEGRGRERRYYILGANLIKYLKAQK